MKSWICLLQSAKEPFGQINLPPFHLLPWTPSSTSVRPSTILVWHHSEVHLIWTKKQLHLDIQDEISGMLFNITYSYISGACFFERNVRSFFFLCAFDPSTWLAEKWVEVYFSTCVLQPSSLPAVGCVFVSSGPVIPFTVKWWEWSQNSAQLSSSTPQPWPAKVISGVKSAVGGEVYLKFEKRFQLKRIHL